jgi:hypothetical protein
VLTAVSEEVEMLVDGDERRERIFGIDGLKYLDCCAGDRDAVAVVGEGVGVKIGDGERGGSTERVGLAVLGSVSSSSSSASHS